MFNSCYIIRFYDLYFSLFLAAQKSQQQISSWWKIWHTGLKELFKQVKHNLIHFDYAHLKEKIFLRLSAKFQIWRIFSKLFAVVAFGGILGNVASCYILSRREMRNSFNLLLVMLSVYDTFYLLFAILDSCRKFFEVGKKSIHLFSSLCNLTRKSHPIVLLWYSWYRHRN